MRAVIDVSADLVAVPHDETAQGPLAPSHRKAPRTRVRELVQWTDHPLEIEFRHARAADEIVNAVRPAPAPRARRPSRGRAPLDARRSTAGSAPECRVSRCR